MKKVLTIIMITLTITMFFAINITVGYIETHYIQNGYIVEINDNTISVVTEDGNLWDFCGKGYKINDTVKVTFFTNYTDLNVYDDEIEKVSLIN